MQNIDFLPTDFKRRRTNRHGRSWQIVVGIAAIGLLVAAAMAQSRAHSQIKARLAQIEPGRNLLDAQQSELAEMRARLAETEAQAGLLAYMGHPWPKTQLLAAALRSVPDAIVYDRVHIALDSQPGQAPRRQTGEDAEVDLTTLEPALRDMQLLQQEYDIGVVAIVLEGITTDGIELHRYLDGLNDVPLLDKVELQSLESTNDESEVKFRFEARLTVRPGFGQPNGPDGPSQQLAQANPDSRLIDSESNQP